MTAVFLVLVAAGCASQNQEFTSGPAFCRSYEDNYLFECQQACEGEDRYSEVAAQDTINACKKGCLDELADDSQFNKSCPDRVNQIESQS
jgi:hypothetical protein